MTEKHSIHLLIHSHH